MHPPTHALASWLLAETAPSLDRRGRAAVLLAGLAPDLDGLTLLGGADLYAEWHRTLLHHAVGAVLCSAVLAHWLGGSARARVFLLALDYKRLLGFLVVNTGAPPTRAWEPPFTRPWQRRAALAVWVFMVWQLLVEPF